MLKRNLALTFLIFSLSQLSLSADLGHSVSGGGEVEDVLGAKNSTGDNPHIPNGPLKSSVDDSKTRGEDYIFNHGVKEVSGDVSPQKKFEDFGYTAPGTYEKQENYLELNKVKMANEFRKVSSGAINLSFIQNNFSYQSTDDVINRTISSGAKSVKGGSLYLRHDDYMTKSMLLNTHWSLGAGLGYNSGRGIFIDGTRSETTFNLWEFPIDLGVGLEIPIYHWFKIAGTAGPSALVLLQNRSDFQRGEKGKRKFQYSSGYFTNAQFKINLSGFGGDVAYDLFTASQITNLFLNLEVRHQNYASFQDEIEVSGTSFGMGFTFEYL